MTRRQNLGLLLENDYYQAYWLILYLPPTRDF